MIRETVSLNEVRDYCLDCVARLPLEVKRVRVTKPYQLHVGSGLLKLTEKLTSDYSGHGV